MKALVEDLQALVPDYANDLRLNIFNVMNSDGIDKEIDAPYIALASALTAKNKKVADLIASHLPNEVDKNAAYIAAVTMAQNNAWYSFVESMGSIELLNMPTQLHMESALNHGNTEKTKFEGYSLAASVINKCRPCIKSHYDELKNMGYRTEQLRNIARIAVVINALCYVVD